LCSYPFISLFLTSALKTICDGGREISGAMKHASSARDVREQRAAEHFGVISAAVMGDHDVFGLGLPRLGFGSPTSVASSSAQIRRCIQDSSTCVLCSNDHNIFSVYRI
jgi:hypothetical protein